MRKFVLFDTESRYADLLPLSFTRPVADFRVGIMTLRQKWEARIKGDFFYMPVDYLTTKFGTAPEDCEDLTFISGSLLATDALASKIEGLAIGEGLYARDGELIAYRGASLHACVEGDRSDGEVTGETVDDAVSLKFVFDLFLNNSAEIIKDFAILTAGRQSQPIPDYVTLIGLPEMSEEEKRNLVFIEDGATVDCASINVKEGPVYVGRNATMMEGSVVRGPLSLGEKAVIKMGAKIYGGTTFGPYCKIGGEVSNTIIFGYSNKAHDGYLGNAVIGEWCNLGAGVNASNLKNDYSKIRIWNYPRHTFMRTDLQFCGLIMGDHSKAGINVMFNTATVVGVGCNLHGAGFPRVFVPSFCQGSPAGGLSDVGLKKFYEVAERVMSRRNISLTDGDRRIYERVYEVASRYKW